MDVWWVALFISAFAFSSAVFGCDGPARILSWQRRLNRNGQLIHSVHF